MQRARRVRAGTGGAGAGKPMIRLCGSTALGHLSVVSEAAQLLNWDGKIIPSLELLGSRVCVIASLNEYEHIRRQQEGAGAAVTDPWMLQFDEGPRRRGEPARWRPSPVQIAGVMACRRTWKAALTTASGFAAFCPRAVVLPGEEARNRRLRLEAAICGVGIVALHVKTVSVAQRPGPAIVSDANRCLAHRVLEETVYARLLTDSVSVH